MKPRSRTKTLLLRIGLAIAAPCLLLLLIEGILQLILEPPRLAAKREFLARSAAHYSLADRGMLQQDPHPAIRFALRPGFDAEIGGKRYRINSLGQRGPQAEKNKPAGLRRVLLLGDSYAFGLGVGDEETLGAALRSLLQDADPPVQVLNLGVPAYHTGQQLAQLTRDGPALQPDVVLLAYYANDNVNLTFLLDPAIRMLYVDAMPLPLGLRRGLAGSILYSYVSRGYTRLQETRGKLASTGPLHWPATSRRLAAIQDWCRSRRVPLILLPIPALDASPSFFDPAHTYNLDHDRVLALAAESDLTCVDARARLQHWCLAADPRLPEAARQSPAGLADWAAAQLGKKKLESDALLPAYQQLELRLRPVEGLFCIPEGPHKDSHLSGVGYRLLAQALLPALRRALDRSGK